MLQLLFLEHTPHPPTASPQDSEGNVEPVVECAAHLQHTAGRGCVSIPCKGGVCQASGGPEPCPAACWPLSSFLAILVERTGKKVVLPALGDHAHSEIPACKSSSQLFKIGKYICLKISFPGVRRSGMKGGGLDVCLSHGQAAHPRSERPGQGEIQAHQAAGQESLLQDSGHCIKTSCQVLGWRHSWAAAVCQPPGAGCTALGQPPGEAHLGCGYCRGV